MTAHSRRAPRRRATLSSGALLGLLMLLAACAAPGAPTAARDGATAAQPVPRGPKTVTIGILGEPGDIYGFGTLQIGNGAKNVEPIVHDTLVVLNDRGEYQPELAAQQISIQDGTWRVNPDGTMDVTWRLRPNVTWHDGAPFTSADVAFAFTVRKDPDIGARIPGRPDLMQGISTPDPLTVVLHWSGTYVNAGYAEGLEPLPSHLLADVYAQDKTAFMNSPRFSTGFVGLGPYRIDTWERGAQMELGPFDAYYRGRPPFDRVVVRFMGDPSTMAANLLAGAVDVLLPRGVGVGTALEVQRRWEGTGNVVRFDVDGNLNLIDSQHRVDFARPRNGVTNRDVRQALYQAIDRDAVAGATSEGVAPAADSWFAPGDALRQDVAASIPAYPYDPARARQLLAGAGWTPGADGVLVHAQTGERFELEIRGKQGGDIDREMSAIADYWKNVGLQMSIAPIPPALQNNREYNAAFPGMLVAGPPANRVYEDRYHSRNIASPGNDWVGTNRFGYNNAAVDRILDRLTVALDPGEHADAHAQLVKEMMGDVGIMPLSWEVVPVLAVQGLRTHKVADNNATWDMFTWDRE